MKRPVVPLWQKLLNTTAVKVKEQNIIQEFAIEIALLNAFLTTTSIIYVLFLVN